MHSEEHRLDAAASEAEILALVERLNRDPAIHGILVQLPLPAHVDEARVVNAVAAEKDVDGFGIANAGRLATGLPGMVPCTPLGCLMLLRDRLGALAGLDAVVIGRSNIVGKPMAQLLLRESCTVTIAHSRTRELAAVCARADILVAAVGRPGLVKADLGEAGGDGDRCRDQPGRRRRRARRSWSATSISPGWRRSPARSRRCRAGSGR